MIPVQLLAPVSYALSDAIYMVLMLKADAGGSDVSVGHLAAALVIFVICGVVVFRTHFQNKKNKKERSADSDPMDLLMLTLGPVMMLETYETYIVKYPTGMIAAAKALSIVPIGFYTELLTGRKKRIERRMAFFLTAVMAVCPFVFYKSSLNICMVSQSLLIICFLSLSTIFEYAAVMNYDTSEVLFFHSGLSFALTLLFFNKPRSYFLDSIRQYYTAHWQELIGSMVCAAVRIIARVYTCKYFDVFVPLSAEICVVATLAIRGYLLRTNS